MTRLLSSRYYDDSSENVLDVSFTADRTITFDMGTKSVVMERDQAERFILDVIEHIGDTDEP